MEGNPNDKALREKLLSAEYTYDPAAWGQMEQMLDAKKKRRGFIWWWWTSGALAAALLIGTGMYVSTDRRSDSTGSSHAAIAGKTTPASTHISQQSMSGEEPLSNHSNSTSVADANNGSRSTTTSISSTSEQNNIQTSAALVASYKPGNITVHSTSAPRHKHKNSTFTSPALSSSIAARKLTHRSALTSTSFSSAGNENAKSNTIRKSGISYETLGTEAMYLNSVNYNCLIEDKGEETPTIPLSRKRKISISYQLGVEGATYASYAKKTFGGPTWGIGLSQQLNIGKYFAITNNILYSEVNFTINNPLYPDNNYNTLDRYHSHISEIAIPIGVKVYPYSNKLIRIGIGISYVNHIKLDETFDYKLTAKPNNVGSYTDLSSFPSGIASSDPSQYQYNSPAHGNAAAEYYSLGRGRKYYGSMMYTIGVEFLLPKHFSISAEPAVRMSLGKIRMQNSRVTDMGMNAGVKYTF